MKKLLDILINLATMTILAGGFGYLFAVALTQTN